MMSSRVLAALSSRRLVLRMIQSWLVLLLMLPLSSQAWISSTSLPTPSTCRQRQSKQRATTAGTQRLPRRDSSNRNSLASQRVVGLFVLQQQQQQQQQQDSDVSSLSSSSASSSSSAASIKTTTPNNSNHRFHQDMRRVLQARHGALDGILRIAKQRHQKPPVLATSDYDLDGADRVLSMLHHLQSLGAADEESYAIVMEAFVKRDRIRWYATVPSSSSGNSDSTRILKRSAEQVEELLEELQLQQQQQESSSPISLQTYLLTLQAYANCATPRGDLGYARRAQGLLEQVQAQYSQSANDDNQQQLLLQCQLLVLRAHAREQANLQGSECVDRAQALLEQLQDQTNEPALLMPALHFVLEAWSKCGSETSVAQAEACLASIQAIHQELLSTPAGLANADALQWFNADVYSNAILAWSKSNASGAAERSHFLLLELLRHYDEGAFPADSEPTLIAFNGVILAYCRSGRPDLAEDILRLVETTSQSCSNLSADIVSYNTILNAYLRNSNFPPKAALQRIRKLIQYMEDQPFIRPNGFTYKTLLTAWLQSGEHNLLVESELLLNKMVLLWNAGDTSVEPSNRIFNKVINAYAKSRDAQAATHVLAIVDRMKQSTQYRPDIITYTSALECLSNARHPSASAKAETLLEEAFALYKTSGDPVDRPNVRTFTMIIATLAKNQGRLERAFELLQQLVQMYQDTQDPQLRPNAFPYNYVLNCAAYTLQSNKTEAFRIAAKAYQGLRDSDIVEPDCFTYAFWLSCCNNLLVRGSELQQKCVSYAVEECKQKGLLSPEVIKRLCQGNRPDVVAQLLNLPTVEEPNQGTLLYSQVRLRNLPPEWSANSQKRQT